MVSTFYKEVDFYKLFINNFSIKKNIFEISKSKQTIYINCILKNQL